MLVRNVRRGDDLDVEVEGSGLGVRDPLADRGVVAHRVVIPPAGYVGVGAAQLLDGGRQELVLGMPAQFHAHGRDEACGEIGPVDDPLPGHWLTEQVVLLYVARALAAWWLAVPSTVALVLGDAAADPPATAAMFWLTSSGPPPGHSPETVVRRIGQSPNVAEHARTVRPIVTGASSGLGAETARTLAAAGAQVTLAARNTRLGSAVAARISDDARLGAPRVAYLDLADPATALRLASR